MPLHDERSRRVDDDRGLVPNERVVRRIDRNPSRREIRLAREHVLVPNAHGVVPRREIEGVLSEEALLDVAVDLDRSVRAVEQELPELLLERDRHPTETRPRPIPLAHPASV